MCKSFQIFVSTALLVFVTSRAWADGPLIQFTQRVTKTVTGIGSHGTYVWSFEDRNPYSLTFGQVFLMIRLEPTSYWNVRRIEHIAQGGEIFSPPPPYEYDVSVQGGFFETYQGATQFRPVGLVIQNGTHVSDLEQWNSGGVLSLNAGITSITPVRYVTASFSPQQAIQSKPLLIEYGSNAMLSHDTERFNRTAIGLSRGGRIIIAGVFSPNNNASTLYDFADALEAVSQQQGDPLATALNMDGGPGAHIFIKTTGRFYGYDGATYIPNVIDFGVSSF